MFVLSKRADSASQVIATLLAIAVVMWALGLHHIARAANLTDVSNTLTDSAPSPAESGHFIAFTIPTGSSLGAGDDIVVTFPTGFTAVDATVSGDLTVRVEGGAAETIGSFTAVGQVITFDGVAATAGEEITIEIAPNVITNPVTVQSYEFVITTQAGDSGRTQVAIVDTVLVTASVQTEFEFVISGLATSTSVNGVSSTISGTTTTIPFGVLTNGVEQSIAQRLGVTTNAIQGFVVTVEQDGNLESSTGADIDGFFDGTYVDTPTTWAAPSNGLLLENEWGHWGLTTNDSDLSVPFGNNEFVAASTTPRLVFEHDGPSDGTTQDVGEVEVLYQVEITSLQEAADDYSAILTYIATPTF